MLNFIFRHSPLGFQKITKSLFFKFKLKKTSFFHRAELKRIEQKYANGEKIKVAFLVIHDSVFKYENLYRFMEKSELFDPRIFICPYKVADSSGMKRDLERTVDSFEKLGFYVFSTLVDGKWYDIKAEFNPDFVFFTNPWDGVTLRQYTIHNFYNKLTCYVPYGFKNSNLYEAHFNKDMACFTWKFFLETKIHQELSKIYARNKGRNTVVLGYPGGDIFLDNKAIEDPWISKNQNVKRIIWAPHHTLPGMGDNLDYSTFLNFSGFIVELAKKYQGKVEFAFKPHPILRHKLSKSEYWGESKTTEFYNFWENSGFTRLEEGNYSDLFLTSDALIHDSSSFVVEYLYLNKPVLFLFKEEEVFNRFNEFGIMAIKKSYVADNEIKISQFIEDVVLKGEDELSIERASFFEQYLKPPFNKSASQNIFDYLVNSFNPVEKYDS